MPICIVIAKCCCLLSPPHHLLGIDVLGVNPAFGNCAEMLRVKYVDSSLLPVSRCKRLLLGMVNRRAIGQSRCEPSEFFFSCLGRCRPGHHHPTSCESEEIFYRAALAVYDSNTNRVRVEIAARRNFHHVTARCLKNLVAI